MALPTDIPPLRLNRNVLAGFLGPDHQAIKQFENLFKVAGEAINSGALDAALVAANAQAGANAALGLLASLMDLISTAALAPAPNQSAVEQPFIPPAVAARSIRQGIAYFAGDGVTTAFALPGIWNDTSDPLDFDVAIDAASQNPSVITVINGTMTFTEPPPSCAAGTTNITVRSRR